MKKDYELKKTIDGDTEKVEVIPKKNNAEIKKAKNKSN